MRKTSVRKTPDEKFHLALCGLDLFCTEFCTVQLWVPSLQGTDTLSPLLLKLSIRFWYFQKISYFTRIWSCNMLFTYQSTTTKKDHEDNESLKPVVLNNAIAGFPKIPPDLSFAFFYTYLTEWKLFNTP